jgi:hypothetical protein
MPRAVGHRAARKVAGCRLDGSDPIARVVRIGVATIPVIGGERIANKVVTAYPAPGQIGMVGYAGIEECNPNAAGARSDIPGRGGLNAVRLEIVPLCGVGRIIRRQRRKHESICLGVLDVGQSGELPGNRFDLQERQPSG